MRRSYRLSCEEEKKGEKRDLVKAEVDEFETGIKGKKGSMSGSGNNKTISGDE